MRIRRSLIDSLIAGLVALGLAFTLHACQSTPQTSPPPSPAAEVAQPSPTATPLPPETLAIVNSAGSKGLFKPDRGDVRFVVISDLNSAYGSVTYDPEVDTAIKLMPFWNPDLVLCSGDMVAGQNPGLPDSRFSEMWAAFNRQVAAPLRQMNIPFGMTMGNHDASSALSVYGKFLFQRERDVAADYWKQPAHNPGVSFVDKFEFPFYYTFEFNDIFFLVWDSSSTHLPESKLAWVEKALGSEKAQSAKMRVVIGHLPLYAVAVGRDEPAEVVENADAMRAMLEKYKVHTYISGHHHAYYPAHRGKLQLLHMGILGSGPRPYLVGSQAPRKSLTVVDVNFDSPELTTYTTYDMQTLQLISYSELPRMIVGNNGVVIRRDVEQLSQEEQQACESQIGIAGCSA
ncbi:MAG: metallophosphoesterase [Leptolyngbyaceae cyanobacterium bins.302]|nr:metallophosphoesterase [Leptolyngbyaceae cyanobacterium bins.302]